MDYNQSRSRRDGMQMPGIQKRDNAEWRRPAEMPYHSMPERHVGMPQPRYMPQPYHMPQPHHMPQLPYMQQQPYMPYYQEQQPMPYHMAYPYPMYMQETDDDEKDLDKIMSMMPETARYIQPMVEDECDRMEYDGSLMFDEYPDKVMMERIIESLYQRMSNSHMTEEVAQESEVFATQCRNCGNSVGDGLRDLISVMLFEEMHRRRCRHRRCKRWW